MVNEEYPFHGKVNFWQTGSNWNIQIQPTEGGTQSGQISDKGYELISELLSEVDEPLHSGPDEHDTRLTIDDEEYVLKNIIPESKGLEGVAKYIARTIPHRKYHIEICTAGQFEGGWIVYMGPRRVRTEDEIKAELDQLDLDRDSK